jgi:hypothetical protein
MRLSGSPDGPYLLSCASDANGFRLRSRVNHEGVVMEFFQNLFKQRTAISNLPSESSNPTGKAELALERLRLEALATTRERERRLYSRYQTLSPEKAENLEAANTEWNSPTK